MTTTFIRLVLIGLLLVSTSGASAEDIPESLAIKVELFEQLEPTQLLNLNEAERTLEYTEPAFGFVTIPTKYSANALPLDRSSPFALRASHRQTFPKGRHQFRLRARGRAQLRITQSEQTLTLQTHPQRPNKSSHDALPPEPYIDPRFPNLRAAPAPHQEIEIQFHSDGTAIDFELVAIIGGKGLVPSPSELSVSTAKATELPRLLSSQLDVPLTDADWYRYRSARLAAHQEANDQRRRQRSAEVREAWARYHEAVRQWAVEVLPPLEIPVRTDETAPHNPIDRFIENRLTRQDLHFQPPITDLAFLRRLALDVTGRIPTEDEITTFLANPSENRRDRAIDHYLTLPEWADHWVGYWQDVLAENPGILKPDLNNSGPFRWWLHQSFSDNLPMDRLAAELIQMKGSKHQGAPAAFGMATLNDAPMAAKADILLQAFQGEKLSCARCHDAPEHRHMQLDTFQLAAMLSGHEVTLPASSTVPVVEGFRRPRVEVSLTPGQTILPVWPLEELAAPHYLMGLIPLADGAPESRNTFARHIVSPTNERFAQVLVNRVWKRYLGAGLVEPAEDWEYHEPSHPELLRFLARKFVLGGYDLKQLARSILSTRVYQAQPVTNDLRESRPSQRHFAGPNQRRMSAEQLVDSLFLVTNKPLATEELNLNPLGDRPLSQFLNLGVPRRAWEFAALMNERDRPSLALPSAQAVVDVLTAFGWRQSRMSPQTDREDDASAVPTLMLANGVVGSQVTRLTDDHAFTDLAMHSTSPGALVEQTIRRLLTRSATAREQDFGNLLLTPHFADRIIPGATVQDQRANRQDQRVSWANHFDERSNSIRLDEEKALRQGAPPTQRLTPSFREAYEDFIWSVINAAEFLVIP